MDFVESDFDKSYDAHLDNHKTKKIISVLTKFWLRTNHIYRTFHTDHIYF